MAGPRFLLLRRPADWPLFQPRQRESLDRVENNGNNTLWGQPVWWAMSTLRVPGLKCKRHYWTGRFSCFVDVSRLNFRCAGRTLPSWQGRVRTNLALGTRNSDGCIERWTTWAWDGKRSMREQAWPSGGRPPLQAAAGVLVVTSRDSNEGGGDYGRVPSLGTAGRRKMARPERFELPTAWFVARYSIQLSYGRVFCGNLGPRIMRRPHGGVNKDCQKMAEREGFEPSMEL
jgi:hypothetical protein